MFWGGAFKIQFFIDVLGPGGGTFFGEGAALGKMETVLKAMSYFRKAGGVWGLLARLLVFFVMWRSAALENVVPGLKVSGMALESGSCFY